MSDQAIKHRNREQFGGQAQAYVESRSHMRGDDLPRLVDLLDPGPDDRILDIATGGGNVALRLAPLAGSVVASDLTQAMLTAVERSFRDAGITNVSFEVADAEALPFGDATFDAATCRIAPHHFPNPGRFVRETYRVLRPGGTFVLIDTTVPEGPIGAAHNEIETMRDPSHVRSLTIAEWRALLEGAGFAVRAVEDYPKRHEFDDWTARAGMSDEATVALSEAVIAAGADYATAFGLETDAERVVAFTDVKTLFFAARPG